jgi:predicted nucleotidyltransferase
MRFGLSDEVLKDLTEVFSKYSSIEHVLIFGSRALGIHQDGSDIDLAVFAKNMSKLEFANLWGDIDTLPLVFKVDCLHWNALSHQNLKNNILKQGVLFYKH